MIGVSRLMTFAAFDSSVMNFAKGRFASGWSSSREFVRNIFSLSTFSFSTLSSPRDVDNFRWAIVYGAIKYSNALRRGTIWFTTSSAHSPSWPLYDSLILSATAARKVPVPVAGSRTCTLCVCLPLYSINVLFANPSFMHNSVRRRWSTASTIKPTTSFGVYQTPNSSRILGLYSAKKSS